MEDCEMMKRMKEWSQMPVLPRLSHARPFIMGCAILSVMLYHYSPLLEANTICLFKRGHYGVELFLLLSGMGLVHLLGKDNRLGAFYYRRAIRILPALFLAYVAIHLSSGKSWIYSFGCMGWNWWYIRGLFFYYMVAPLPLPFFRHGPLGMEVGCLSCCAFNVYGNRTASQRVECWRNPLFLA